ncbi:MAG TPA: hypothetical protein VKE51_39715 [Vicinamibacterales bacterium]|nr:hypothetical protein [Vicinamibacterales bacterium]
MRNRVIGALAVVAAAGVVAFWLALSPRAQAEGAGTQTQLPPPRGRPIGPPQPTPRLPDGTPNLGRVSGEKGMWNPRIVLDFGNRVVGHEVPEAMNRGSTTTALGGAHRQPWVPFMPWSAAIYNYNLKNEAKYDPEGYCLPPGGPRLMATPYPLEILQLPEQKRIIMIFEGAAHIWREIYMDGRPHPQGDALNPTYLGHSVGRWERDTLVVDIVGFNEGSWLDPVGHVHTDLLHVIERYSRPEKGTLHYEATIDDPGAYTAPWTVGWDVRWSPNGELAEYICQENNRYMAALKDDFGNPIVGRKP